MTQQKFFSRRAKRPSSAKRDNISLVTTGLDPVVHAEVQLRKPFGHSKWASPPHGLPDHRRTKRRRSSKAMSGNDEGKKPRKKKGSGTPTDAWSHETAPAGTAARFAKARSPVGVPPRLLPWGFRPVRLNFRPGFLGRDRYEVLAKWALPTPVCPSPVMHLTRRP